MPAPRVVQDVRGRFASEGEGGPWTHEERHGYDTAWWAAALPASNGSVGLIDGSRFGNARWRAAPPEPKVSAPQITWSDPDDGCGTRGGAIELSITAPWSLTQGVGTLTRRHRTDPDGFVSGTAGFLPDLAGLTSDGHGELSAEPFPAFARHDLPEIGHERSRREPDRAWSCRLSGPRDRSTCPSSRPTAATTSSAGARSANFTAVCRADRSATLITGS
ncbi:CocE/NonD family hydrolase [Streptomyces sp. NPDC003522]